MKKWQEADVWGRIFQSLQDNAYRAGLISMDSVSIDSKTVVAKKGGEFIGYGGHKNKKGTKVHAVVDKKGNPLRLVISAARQYLRKRGIKSNIPVNKRNSKRMGRGRPTRFDEEAYKNRGFCERGSMQGLSLLKEL